MLWFSKTAVLRNHSFKYHSHVLSQYLDIVVFSVFVNRYSVWVIVVLMVGGSCLHASIEGERKSSVKKKGSSSVSKPTKNSAFNNTAVFKTAK